MDFLNRARRRLNGFANGVSQGLTDAARHWAESALDEPPPPPMPAPRAWYRQINAGSFGNSHFCTQAELQDSGLIANPIRPGGRSVMQEYRSRTGNGIYLGRFVDPYAPCYNRPPIPTWYGEPSTSHHAADEAMAPPPC
jgi:hypothetical protein